MPFCILSSTFQRLIVRSLVFDLVFVNKKITFAIIELQSWLNRKNFTRELFSTFFFLLVESRSPHLSPWEYQAIPYSFPRSIFFMWLPLAGHMERHLLWSLLVLKLVLLLVLEEIELGAEKAPFLYLDWPLVWSCFQDSCLWVKKTNFLTCLWLLNLAVGMPFHG